MSKILTFKRQIFLHLLEKKIILFLYLSVLLSITCLVQYLISFLFNYYYKMAEATIIIDINGYWREEDLSIILSHPGVFFVYESKFDPDELTVDLLSLIYIGEAQNIRERIRTHEKLNLWKTLIQPDSELCFATGDVEEYFLERVKTAYVFGNNPVANYGHVTQFPFDTTTLISTGKTALLKPILTIKKSFPKYIVDPSLLQQNLIPVRSVQVERYPGK